jgi:hypothetical protein
MSRARVNGDENDGNITVHVPLAFRRRGGRKVVQVPDGSSWAPSRPRVDNTLVKALARAHRWQRMLEGGDYDSVAELAAAEKINPSYVARVLRLTLLAPELTQAILDGLHDPQQVTVGKLMMPFPSVWEAQEAKIFLASAPNARASV